VLRLIAESVKLTSARFNKYGLWQGDVLLFERKGQDLEFPKNFTITHVNVKRLSLLQPGTVIQNSDKFVYLKHLKKKRNEEIR
jgi:hypothetical protein